MQVHNLCCVQILKVKLLTEFIKYNFESINNWFHKIVCSGQQRAVLLIKTRLEQMVYLLNNHTQNDNKPQCNNKCVKLKEKINDR